MFQIDEGPQKPVPEVNERRRLKPFIPHPLVRGGHLQTVVGYLLPNPPSLPETVEHTIRLPDGDRLVLCANQPRKPAGDKRAVLLMHGLGGHADSGYMLRVAQQFLRYGWQVFRLNHRGAGQGRGLARQLYHSGKSEDLTPVFQSISEIAPAPPLVAVGFSLSGNMLLKYLGEQENRLPGILRGAIAVNAPVDLHLASAAICRRRNRLYDLRFIRLLLQALNDRQQAYPDFPAIHLSKFPTLYEFDQRVTAPLCGFSSAEDYYTRCSARPLLGQIRLPTLLLTSDDDPFVPLASYQHLPSNAFLRVLVTRSGGHMGYIARDRTPLGTHRWMDYALVHAAELFLQR